MYCRVSEFRDGVEGFMLLMQTFLSVKDFEILQDKIESPEIYRGSEVL